MIYYFIFNKSKGNILIKVLNLYNFDSVEKEQAIKIKVKL
jgi:hypothetical protein